MNQDKSNDSWICTNCGGTLNEEEVTIIKSSVPIICRYCDHTITIDLYRKQTEEDSLVYPVGELEVQQNVVPLDIELQRYGGGRPDDDADDEEEDNADSVVQDFFARGQYQTMSNKEKLDTPHFEQVRSGMPKKHPFYTQPLEKVCPHCNHRNEIGNRFCANCGASI